MGLIIVLHQNHVKLVGLSRVQKKRGSFLLRFSVHLNLELRMELQGGNEHTHRSGRRNMFKQTLMKCSSQQFYTESSLKIKLN